jgi:putative transcriptional regulator
MELALGERIRIARTRCKKSQVELARDVGISKTTLSDIETGKTVAPSSAIITDIARVLDVSADFLLGLRDDPVPPTNRSLRMSIRASSSTPTVTAWLTYSFAPDWFADALREAQTGQDHHARRREIVFAVCFAESYLLEWVRDEVLKGAFPRLNGYFVPGKWQSVVDKWKDIPKQLRDDRLIPAIPKLGESYWEDWLKLVNYRNGLVHARASRPESGSQGNESNPLPSRSDLDRLPAGWAVQVVVTLVRRLHDAVGTSPPTWLVDP